MKNVCWKVKPKILHWTNTELHIFDYVCVCLDVIERGTGGMDLIPTVFSLRVNAEEAVVTDWCRSEFKSGERTQCKWHWVHIFHMGQQPCRHCCHAGNPFGQQSCATSKCHRQRQHSPFPPALLPLPSNFCQERYFGERIPMLWMGLAMLA